MDGEKCKMISTPSTKTSRKKKKTVKNSCKCTEEENILHNFDATAICDIIDQCSKSGVSEFSFDKLHIHFNGSPLELAKPLSDKETFIEPTEIGDTEISPVEKEITQDFEDAQQIIDDPDAFEERIIDGFINGNNLNEEADY